LEQDTTQLLKLTKDLDKDTAKNRSAEDQLVYIAPANENTFREKEEGSRSIQVCLTKFLIKSGKGILHKLAKKEING